MPVRAIALMTVIMMSCLANAVSAQDTPRVGISMGYPASIGVIWQVTDDVALRPEISFQKRSGQSTTTRVALTFVGGVPSGGTTITTSTSTTDFWQAGVGLSALVYLSKHDALRTYVSPRWAYMRNSSDAPSGLSDLINYGSTGSGHLVAGSFGAQYALGRKFSAFGEVGLEFTRTVSTPNDRQFGSGQDVFRTFGTRSAAGVILYF
jgi:hypothetical protein